MHVCVLATQKGGSGKSTLAIGLAVTAMEDGWRVGIVDSDPQGTVSSWHRRREETEPRLARAGSAHEIAQALEAFRRGGVTLAVIDTPASDNILSRAAIELADLCLIPARPTPADIEGALPTLAAVRGLGKPFAFALSQTPARSFRLSEAATALERIGVLALPYIVQRNDHQDALGAGLGVTEYDPSGKAAEEVRGLWAWVTRKLAAEAKDHDKARIRATG